MFYIPIRQSDNQRIWDHHHPITVSASPHGFGGDKRTIMWYILLRRRTNQRTHYLSILLSPYPHIPISSYPHSLFGLPLIVSLDSPLPQYPDILLYWCYNIQLYHIQIFISLSHYSIISLSHYSIIPLFQFKFSMLN